ncbi:hypothetical protein Tco_0795410 [Tanacetum coccineum]
MSDMGSRIHGMRLLEPYRELQLDDEQGQRQLLAGQVNMLFRDRRTHAHTCQLMEIEAGMSREAWGRAMDASDLAHGEGHGDSLYRVGDDITGAGIMDMSGAVAALAHVNKPGMDDSILSGTGVWGLKRCSVDLPVMMLLYDVAYSMLGWIEEGSMV